jgi:hypothetical protein
LNLGPLMTSPASFASIKSLLHTPH